MLTYDEIANENLQDLGAQTGTALESLLECPDEEVAQRSADESAIGGHLRDTSSEVVSVLVAVLGKP